MSESRARVGKNDFKAGKSTALPPLLVADQCDQLAKLYQGSFKKSFESVESMARVLDKYNNEINFGLKGNEEQEKQRLDNHKEIQSDFNKVTSLSKKLAGGIMFLAKFEVTYRNTVQGIDNLNAKGDANVNYAKDLTEAEQILKDAVGQLNEAKNTVELTHSRLMNSLQQMQPKIENYKQIQAPYFEFSIPELSQSRNAKVDAFNKKIEEFSSVRENFQKFIDAGMFQMSKSPEQKQELDELRGLREQFAVTSGELKKLHQEFSNYEILGSSAKLGQSQVSLEGKMGEFKQSVENMKARIETGKEVNTRLNEAIGASMQSIDQRVADTRKSLDVGMQNSNQAPSVFSSKVVLPALGRAPLPALNTVAEKKENESRLALPDKNVRAPKAFLSALPGLGRSPNNVASQLTAIGNESKLNDPLANRDRMRPAALR